MADTILDYVTPEMFGAVGDGIADDTAAWQTAVSKEVDIHANSQARYLITSPIKLPYMNGYQLIEGNNCTLITLGNYSPFGQFNGNGTTQVVTIRKNFQNIFAIGGVNKNTAWDNASSAVFLSFSYGYAKNINAIGFCNALRAYGHTGIHGPKISLAMTYVTHYGALTPLVTIRYRILAVAGVLGMASS